MQPYEFRNIEGREVPMRVQLQVAVDLLALVVEASKMRSQWHDYPGLWSKVREAVTGTHGTVTLNKVVNDVFIALKQEHFPVSQLLSWRAHITEVFVEGELRVVKPQGEVTDWVAVDECAEHDFSKELWSRIVSGDSSGILSPSRMPQCHASPLGTTVLEALVSPQMLRQLRAALAQEGDVLRHVSGTAMRVYEVDVFHEVAIIVGAMATVESGYRQHYARIGRSNSPVFIEQCEYSPRTVGDHHDKQVHFLHWELARLAQAGRLTALEALLMGAGYGSDSRNLRGRDYVKVLSARHVPVVDVVAPVEVAQEEVPSSGELVFSADGESPGELSLPDVEEYLLGVPVVTVDDDDIPVRVPRGKRWEDDQRVEALRLLAWFRVDTNWWNVSLEDVVAIACATEPGMPMSVLLPLVAAQVQDKPKMYRDPLGGMWYWCRNHPVWVLWRTVLKRENIPFLMHHEESH